MLFIKTLSQLNYTSRTVSVYGGVIRLFCTVCPSTYIGLLHDT